MIFGNNPFEEMAKKIDIDMLKRNQISIVALIQELEKKVLYLENELKDIKAKQGE